MPKKDENPVSKSPDLVHAEIQGLGLIRRKVELTPVGDVVLGIRSSKGWTYSRFPGFRGKSLCFLDYYEFEARPSGYDGNDDQCEFSHRDFEETEIIESPDNSWRSPRNGLPEGDGKL